MICQVSSSGIISLTCVLLRAEFKFHSTFYFLLFLNLPSGLLLPLDVCLFCDFLGVLSVVLVLLEFEKRLDMLSERLKLLLLSCFSNEVSATASLSVKLLVLFGLLSSAEISCGPVSLNMDAPETMDAPVTMGPSISGISSSISGKHNVFSILLSLSSKWHITYFICT